MQQSPLEPLNVRSYNKRKELLFNHLRERSALTDDTIHLKRQFGNLIPVFIYDQLMKGDSEDYYLHECPYFGPATTFEDDFFLMKMHNTSLLFFNSHTVKSGENLHPIDEKRIQGDLYGVDLNTIFMLDKGYFNGTSYTRVEIPVMLHTRDGSYFRVKEAQVYAANYSWWKSKETEANKMKMTPPIMSRFRRNERVYKANPKETFRLPLLEHQYKMDGMEDRMMGMGYPAYGWD